MDRSVLNTIAKVNSALKTWSTCLPWSDVPGTSQGAVCCSQRSWCSGRGWTTPV